MFAVVDLETTGGNPGTDKIIEIAIYIHDGVAVRKEYSSLVNPGVPIPTFISRLTRITDEMVSTAPVFSDIAREVSAILGEHIFVAHNVLFDYSFLSYALAREGHHYENKMLCTCKTSRILLPGYPSYSLSRLCHSLSIDLIDAHRAAADAKATAKVLDLLIARSGGMLDPFYSLKEKVVNKSRIPNEQIDKIPGKTGIVFFYDADGNVIYLARAGNVRKKTWSVLHKMQTKRFAGLALAAVAVDYQATGSDLLASILEIELLHKLQPRFNRKPRATESRFSIYERLNDNGYLVLEKGPYISASRPAATFSGEREVNNRLLKLFADYNLLPAADLDIPALKLFTDTPDSYNERVVKAIAELHSGRQNYIITGRGPKADSLSMVVIKNGCYAGYAFTDTGDNRATVEEVLDNLKPGYDHPGIFKAIINFVSQGKYLKIINF
ncbi:MAG: exonuclease domain-containing protein [Bacteroidota bacterium]|nr:exonuclease domain-containing protein [Bacteroidota bacterium]